MPTRSRPVSPAAPHGGGEKTRLSAVPATAAADVCPVCGASLVAEKCKLVCRSAICTYRIIYNCSEF